MINYDKLWLTMKEKGITQYQLYKYHHFSKSLLFRLRHNLYVNLYTLDRLCYILDCNIEDIITHQNDGKERYNNKISESDIEIKG